MKNGKKIGLALSGGGFRATVYHLGTLQKLKELNLLDKIDVISSNSGGSITAAAYGLYGADFKKFEEIVLAGVQKSVIKKMIFSYHFLLPAAIILVLLGVIAGLLFTNLAWLSLLLLLAILVLFLNYQFKIFRLSRVIEHIYNDFFFNRTQLKELLPGVDIVMNSTNVETGRPFTFSRDAMGDSTYLYPKDGGASIQFIQSEFPVARAVTASTCVPFLFSPVQISKDYYKNKQDVNRAKPRLVDGGVYDNQGVHKLTQKNSHYRCEIIIVSDAGNKMPFENSYKNVLALLIRVSDVFMKRIQDLQMVDLIFNPMNPEEVAYQSLGWNLEDSISDFVDNVLEGNVSDAVIKSHEIPGKYLDKGQRDLIVEYLSEKIRYDEIIENSNSKEALALARSVGTNLTALNPKQIDALTRQASLLTEINVKLYCPSLFKA